MGIDHADKFIILFMLEYYRHALSEYTELLRKSLQNRIRNRIIFVEYERLFMSYGYAFESKCVYLKCEISA